MTEGHLKTELYGSEQVHIYIMGINPVFVCHAIETQINIKTRFQLQRYNILGNCKKIKKKSGWL